MFYQLPGTRYRSFNSVLALSAHVLYEAFALAHYMILFCE